MDEMCKRSDRDFPGLQALESVVDGILARAKEEKLKPATLIDSWSQGHPPPKKKKKQRERWDFVVCLYGFSSLGRMVLFCFAAFLFWGAFLFFFSV